MRSSVPEMTEEPWGRAEYREAARIFPRFGQEWEESWFEDSGFDDSSKIGRWGPGALQMWFGTWLTQNWDEMSRTEQESAAEFVADHVLADPCVDGEALCFWEAIDKLEIVNAVARHDKTGKFFADARRFTGLF